MVLTLLPMAMACAGAFAQSEDRVRAGLAAVDRGDLAAAQTDFEAATKAAPDNAGVWLLLAQTYARRKNQPSALDAARKAEKLGAADPEILQGLANVYSSLIPDPVKAASLGARYAELKPGDTTAWQRLAAFCVSTGQPERAIEAGTRALKTGNSAAVHDILGQAYLQRQQWAQAGAELTEAVKLNPYDDQVHFHLAQVYLMQQDWVEAVRVLENARKYFDKSPQIELALGVAFYGQRQFPEAVDQFLKTIQLAPDITQPYVFLGRMLEHAGSRLGEVTARFSDYQARNPKQPLGYVLHAKAMIAQLPPGSNPRQAQPVLELLQQALALKEDDAEAHYLAGLLLERQGDFAKAAAHLERSIALDPKDPAPHYRLARVYARLGRKADSERERALHEKLSSDITVGEARGMALSPKRPPAAQ